MLKFFSLVLFIQFNAFFVFAQQKTDSPTAIALTNATIINIKNGRKMREMTVLVNGNKISAIGRTRRVKIPENAQIVDARGKFLIPGLWDMHVHAWDANVFYPIFLANGITGVRDMGGDLKSLVAYRQQIESGKRVGPRLFFAGQIIDGLRRENLTFLFSFVDTSEAARALVRERKAEGADFIKVYNALEPNVFAAIIDEAKRQNLPVAGHVPISVGVRAAAIAGQRSVEHLTGIALASSLDETALTKQVNELRTEMVMLDAQRTKETGETAKKLQQKIYEISNRLYQITQNESLDTFDRAKFARLNNLFRKQGTWQVPTLAVVGGNDLRADLPQITTERIRFFPEFVRGLILQKNENLSAETRVLELRRFQTKLRIVGAMHAAKVNLLAGSDAPNPNVYPGFSLHDELEFFVQAGLSPLAALQTATINPAVYFNKLNEFGTIETGKYADLVLLDANPLDDIRNTRRIQSVMANGRFYAREALDKMLADAAAKYQSVNTQTK